jgi:CMP-N-acetylneuraminic acid synthetase
VKFLVVIPARSGSETIKKKNLRLINRKPLIQYTFEELKKSNLKEKYLLSDDLKIKNLAKKFNINTTYYRPKKLSKNTSSLIALLNDFHKWTESKKIFYDYMVVLQPTSPLRDYKDINNAVRIVKKKKYKSLFSISESLEHPYECIKIEKNGKWKYVLDKSKLFYRRQDFDFKSYFINGAIYIIHKELITKKKIYDNKKHGLFLMPKYRSIDINDINEIKITESLLMKK